MKRLFITRHAKAERDGISDADRPLSKRGLRNAPEMALRLKEKGFSPDLIVSSPARRALHTARLFAAVFDYPENKILAEAEMYASGVDSLLRTVNAADNSCQNLFLFGHNPEFSLFAEYLSSSVSIDLPTCGVAVIVFDIDDWRLVSGGTGQLVLVDYPKKES